MVSSELTECMGISDRLYVMHEGKITGCIGTEEIRGSDGRRHHQICDRLGCRHEEEGETK